MTTPDTTDEGATRDHPVAPVAIERSVVQLTVHAVVPDLEAPWNAGSIETWTGSGFVIEGGQILTNAHVVSRAQHVVVHLHGDPELYEARVVAVGDDCDLALVECEHANALDKLHPLRFGGLPTLGSVVDTFGYPIGGRYVSSTRGIVSRVEFATYTHTGIDAHLTVQTDAAINPGNSGGPVLQAGLAVGVAFEGIAMADGIGYFIPSSVVEHFLADVRRNGGRGYDGFPNLGITCSTLHNPAARRRAGLDQLHRTGVRVDAVAIGSSADGHVEVGDVLVAVDGLAVADDGTVAFGNHRLDCQVVVDRHQVAESLRLELARVEDGVARLHELRIEELSSACTARLRVIDPSGLPRYFVYAGLVFVTLTHEMADQDTDYLHALEVRSPAEPDYQAGEIVVLASRLDHEVNRGIPFASEVVLERANGVPIRRIEDLIAATESHQGEFHVFEFAYDGRLAVLDRQAADRAHGAILATYGIVEDRRL